MDWTRLWKRGVEDVEASIDCLHRASDSTRWDWSGGSCLFFWRWGRSKLIIDDFGAEARDGARMHIDLGALPTFQEAQPDTANVDQ